MSLAPVADPPWSSDRTRVVTYEEGWKMAQKLNLEYTEMTGQLDLNLEECVEKAVSQVLDDSSFLTEFKLDLCQVVSSSQIQTWKSFTK